MQFDAAAATVHAGLHQSVFPTRSRPAMDYFLALAASTPLIASKCERLKATNPLLSSMLLCWPTEGNDGWSRHSRSRLRKRFGVPSGDA